MVGGSAPLTIVHHRPVVTLDGGVRAVVDTAGAAVLLSQAVADALAIAVIETVDEQGEVFTVLEPPSLAIGGYALDTDLSADTNCRSTDGGSGCAGCGWASKCAASSARSGCCGCRCLFLPCLCWIAVLTTRLLASV